jgi:hypothetical protein
LEKQIGIVVTTISDGAFVDTYRSAAGSYPSSQDISMYVIGDVNTPPECQRRIEQARDHGILVKYIDVPEQEQFLRPFPKMARLIPLRSDQRRNIGFLMALHDHCDVLISVDDDNFPSFESPFFEHHAVVGTDQTFVSTRSRNHWFNTASLLEVSDGSGHACTIYPRGYPHSRRFNDASSVDGESVAGRVAVNVGLWTGDPDVDAATRLVTTCTSRASNQRRYMLGSHQRAPINSQNTSLLWHAIPAYYFVLMRQDIAGMQMDRFGDIFSGYFLQLCVEATGHRICLGPPYVHQDRNVHNILRDLRLEVPGMMLIEAMTDFLEEALPRATSYSEAYLCLADRLLEWSQKQQGDLWTSSTRQFFIALNGAMREWIATCVSLAGGQSALKV